MNQNQPAIQASILYRLIDQDPEVTHEPVQYRLLTFGQIKAAVIRDLENLLNTKRSIQVPPASFREVNDSLFTYGLRDFTAQGPRSLAARQQLRRDIERTIAKFEPRLKNVTLQLEAGNPGDKNLRFRIMGLLVVDPVAEPVTFDTYLDLARGDYAIAK